MAVILTGTEYIDLDAHAAAFDFTPQPVSFTIAFETVSTGVEFLFSHDRGGDAEIGFYHNNGTLNVRYTTTGGSNADLTLGGGFNDGALHRVLAVWTGGTLQGWVDGVLVDSTSTGNMPASTDANMNIGGADGGLLFVGELSECAVWSTALSNGDAADLTDGTSAPDEVTGTLEGWWPLASDAQDASGNDRHGTTVNNPEFTETGGTPVGQATETDTAQLITVLKTRAIGQAEEADAAQPIGTAKTRTLGLATQTDTTFALTAAKAKTISQVAETDLAQSVTFVGATPIGQAAETDQAFAITALKTVTLGLAAEMDLALPISGGGIADPNPFSLSHTEPAGITRQEAFAISYQEPPV